ncbi:hypothetical protein JTE90_000790 [Oedothorax gibbosus]|uniref:Uncharacterized protein n=1 Tax=Oedothorax gibbosus TaxID=931172 RepID=A0AAV6THP7_9ARAC|nr:hypothetical protein JTE90_000790 [Oedothorax gibbosus]
MTNFNPTSLTSHVAEATRCVFHTTLCVSSGIMPSFPFSRDIDIVVSLGKPDTARSTEVAGVIHLSHHGMERVDSV